MRLPTERTKVVTSSSESLFIDLDLEKNLGVTEREESGRRELHDEEIVGGFLQWGSLKRGDCWGCFGVEFFPLGIVEVSVDKIETVLGATVV